MNLLVFNLATDADDPILGFTTDWIRALADRFGEVHVITMRAGRLAVPGNVSVRSVGKEKGFGEVRRFFVFYAHLVAVLRAGHISYCFSHMMPLFSIMAGPLLRLLRIPVVTWFAHPSLTFRLRLAHLVSNRMVTSLPNAYPYRKGKLTVIGQGINTSLFHEERGWDNPRTILCAGRLSPVKDHSTLLRAVHLLRDMTEHTFGVTILGAGVGDPNCRYYTELVKLRDSLGLQSLVRFERPVPRHGLARWYERCFVHVNLTPAGFGDKVAWEAMSCSRLCCVANADFHETLGAYAEALLFPHGDHRALAEKLANCLSLSDTRAAEAGTYLRAQVVRLHSLQSLAAKLHTLFNSLGA